MKIDMSKLILNLEGTPFMEQLDKGSRPMTLRSVCVAALTMPHRSDENLSAAQKLDRFQLALLINEAHEIDLRAEQIAQIKELISRTFSIVIFGRASALLDPKENPNGGCESRESGAETRERQGA